MMVTCPNCGTKFEVPDEAVEPDGRDLICGPCGHGWFQSPPSAIAAPAEDAAHMAEEAPEPKAAAASPVPHAGEESPPAEADGQKRAPADADDDGPDLGDWRPAHAQPAADPDASPLRAVEQLRADDPARRREREWGGEDEEWDDADFDAFRAARRNAARWAVAKRVALVVLLIASAAMLYLNRADVVAMFSGGDEDVAVAADGGGSGDADADARFTLTRDDGTELRDVSLDGAPTLVYLGGRACDGVCRAALARMSELSLRFSGSAVELALAYVAPDAPEASRARLLEYGPAPGAGLIAATGDAGALESLAGWLGVEDVGETIVLVDRNRARVARLRHDEDIAEAAYTVVKALYPTMSDEMARTVAAIE